MGKLTSSVAICTYNGAEFIAEQIRSVLNQTRLVDEIIISDDMSKDSTVEIVKSILKDSPIKYEIIQNEQNLGFYNNFQQCMSKCSGDIIFMCDQDDIWHEDKVELVMEKFEENDNCVLAYHDSRLVDKDGQVICNSSWNALNLKSDGFIGEGTTKEVFRRTLMYRWVVYGNATAIRRKLMEVFPIPTDSTDKELGGRAWTHDSWLAINSWLCGDVIFIDNQLIDYRQHGKNITGIIDKELNETEKIVDKLHHILFYLRAHHLRLQIFLDNAKDRMSSEDVKYVQSFIDLFTDTEIYERASKVKKMYLLFHYFLHDSFKVCGVTRKEIGIYISSLVFK